MIRMDTFSTFVPGPVPDNAGYHWLEPAGNSGQHDDLVVLDHHLVGLQGDGRGQAQWPSGGQVAGPATVVAVAGPSGSPNAATRSAGPRSRTT